MALSDIITTGINNPDCSFFVGTFVGQLSLFKIVTFMVLSYFVFKIIDTLALDPFLKWIKEQIYMAKIKRLKSKSKKHGN
jgi:hypothetical protein